MGLRVDYTKAEGLSIVQFLLAKVVLHLREEVCSIASLSAHHYLLVFLLMDF